MCHNISNVIHSIELWQYKSWIQIQEVILCMKTTQANETVKN